MVASQPLYAVLRMLCRPPPVLLVRMSLQAATGRSRALLAAQGLLLFPKPRQRKKRRPRDIKYAHRVLQRLCYQFHIVF